MTDAGDPLAHPTETESARPDASSTEAAPGKEAAQEQLGRVGRILVIPLVPFVALWGGIKAARLAAWSAVRWLGSALTTAGRYIGELGRAIARPFRDAYLAVIRLARAIARSLAIGARAVLRPLLAAGTALLSLAHRMVLALRAAARAVAVPVRSFGRAVVAGARAAVHASLALVRRLRVVLGPAARLLATSMRTISRVLGAAARQLLAVARQASAAVRWLARRLASAVRQVGVAALRLCRAVSAPIRAVGTWIRRGFAATWLTIVTLIGQIARAARSLVASVGGAVRLAAQAIGGVLRSVVRVCERIARRLLEGIRVIGRAMVGPIKWLADVSFAGARRVVQLLTVIGREVVSAGRAAGRHLGRAGAIITKVVAAPFVRAALLVRGAVRFLTAGGKSVATCFARLARWIWRPVAAVGHGLRRRSKVVAESMRRVRNAYTGRFRQSAASVRRDARVGVRRWTSVIGRSDGSRSTRPPAELRTSPVDEEIPAPLGSDLAPQPSGPGRTEPLRAPRHAPD